MSLWTTAKTLAQTTWTVCKSHSSGIFTGAGVVCYIIALPLAVSGSRQMDQYKEEYDFTEMTRTAKWKYFAKAYWKTGLAVSMATACVFIGHHNLAKNVDALGEALMLSAAREDQLKDSIKKVAGEKKAKLIEEDANKTFCEKEIAKGKPVYDMLDPNYTGGILFVDVMHGTLFRSTFEAIREAYRKFNTYFETGAYTDRGSWQYENELRFMLNLPEVKAGDILGWNWEAVSDSDGLEPIFEGTVQYNGVDYVMVQPNVWPFEKPFD